MSWSSRPARRLLLGAALVATLAAVGGAWVVQLNQYGRWLALAFVALFGLTLLLPRLSLKRNGDSMSLNVPWEGSPG